MRNIRFTITVDGEKTKMTVRKFPQERRFQVLIFKDDRIKMMSEYAISDTTGEVEYYDGQILPPQAEKGATDIIMQYFPNTRPTKKVGEDDYQDYDDY